MSGKLPTPPAFQLYAAQFIAGTASMSDAEVGAYMRLLCHQWLDGCVPNDTAKLRRLAGSSKKTIDTVAAKFPVCDDGNRRNAKLEQVRAAQDEYRAERRAAGMAGAEKRWHSHSSANGSAIAQPSPSHALANGKPMANEWQNDGSSSSSSEDKKPPEPAAQVLPLAGDRGDPASPGPIPKTRPPDPVWDAIAAEFYGGTVTDAHRGQVNRIVKNLKQLGATADDIRTRAANYRANWPEIACTASALVKHWHGHAERRAPATPGRVHAAPGKYAHLDPSAVAQP